MYFSIEMWRDNCIKWMTLIIGIETFVDIRTQSSLNVKWLRTLNFYISRQKRLRLLKKQKCWKRDCNELQKLVEQILTQRWCKSLAIPPHFQVHLLLWKELVWVSKITGVKVWFISCRVNVRRLAVWALPTREWGWNSPGWIMSAKDE